MADDLFTPLEEAEKARLLAAGWVEDKAVKDWFWRPDKRWKLSRAEALKELDREQSDGAKQ